MNTDDISTPDGSRADLDIRSLRYFVAVAEELHFTRAAARLFVAQQALSREVARLEARLGTPLFVRTTRRVTLTPEGERLLTHARELVALHDRVLTELRQPSWPTTVDMLSEGRLTGPRVLELARGVVAPELEFRSVYGGGMGVALGRLREGRVDAAFGRLGPLAETASDLDHRLVRLEPIGLLLPLAHPLAQRPEVPLAALEGLEIDTNPADPKAVEWADYTRQFLALARARPTPPHMPAVGLDEQAHHLVRQGLPILTGADQVAVPGGVVRPVVDPVALYPWSIVFRKAAPTAGLEALLTATETLAEQEGWLVPPAAAWLPEPERSTLEGVTSRLRDHGSRRRRPRSGGGSAPGSPR